MASVTSRVTPARKAFDRDGYLLPARAFGTERAAHYRSRWETVRRAASGEPGVASLLDGPKLHLACTWADELIREPHLLAAVEELIGPGILVWGTAVFLRPPGAEAGLAWHQDAVYYQLAGIDAGAVRAWIALTPTSAENGTIRYSAGSHRRGPQRHAYRSHRPEDLKRGEEMSTPIEPGSEVSAVLEPGQCAFHHLLTAHTSGGNTTTTDRLAVAVDFFAPTVMPLGEGDGAMPVRGDTSASRFVAEPRPEQDLGAAEVARMRHFTAVRVRCAAPAPA